jgi:Flp pilus assembly protein TadG
MSREIASLFQRVRTDESGAAAILVAISIVALVGLTGLAIDMGNLVYAQRRLQVTTDLAAYAGAQFIVAGKAIATANQYSAVNGVGDNTISGLTVTMASGYPQLSCDLNLINLVSCAGPVTQCPASTQAPSGGCNTIVVKQQATVPLIFAQWFGVSTVQLSTSATAARGGGFPPMHIMMVLDDTGSMNNQDGTGTSCGGLRNPTRLQCALAGVQTLLAELWPTQDEVGLIVFPPVSTTSAPNDASCSSTSTITPEAYSCYQSTSAPCPSAGTTYQIVGLSNNYKASNTSTSLASTGSTSSLINATCQSGSSIDQNGVSGSCGTCQGNKAVGGEGTYLAGAINAAQSILTTNAAPGVQNVIIVLSDGGAGNAGNLWSSTTSQSTPAGGTVLTMAATVPADVIPGTSVADNTAPCPTGTSNCAIPAGTQVVSTSGSTVTLSAAVTAAATPTTNAATSPGSTTLHFAAVPSAVVTGMAVSDQTHPTAIAACTTVTAKTATTVTLSNAVVGTTAATGVTSLATAPGGTVLTFGSVPSSVTTGMGVTDTTTSSAIPSGTTVVSFTATTVTLSNTVGVNVTDATNAASNGSATLHFNSVPSTVQTGLTVTGAGISTGTTVVSKTTTTVVLSKAATVARGVTITFAGDSVAAHDTITFTSDVASGDTIAFGGVGCGDTIAFGSNNQCHEAIAAAQKAANAGTWVYSIAYGAYTQLSPNSNSCSDTETPPISSCTTMGAGEPGTPGIASDPTKFYSDPMNVNPPCVSPDNPTATDIPTIFANIAASFIYTQLIPGGM